MTSLSLEPVGYGLQVLTKPNWIGPHTRVRHPFFPPELRNGTILMYLNSHLDEGSPSHRPVPSTLLYYESRKEFEVLF